MLRCCVGMPGGRGSLCSLAVAVLFGGVVLFLGDNEDIIWEMLRICGGRRQIRNHRDEA